MDAALRLGLELPPLPAPGATEADRVAWLDLAGAADRSGFGSVWIGGTAADPCTLAGGLAASGGSLTLGVVAGTGAERRSPSILARDVTAVDVLSGGRAAVLLEGEEGWGRLVEAIEVCRLLFTQDRSTFQGRHFRLEGAVNRPPPLRPGGPLVLAQVPEGSPSVPGTLPTVAGWVVPGAPADVAAWRGLLQGPLVWRGRLADESQAEQLRRAGADGLVVSADATIPPLPAGWPV